MSLYLLHTINNPLWKIGVYRRLVCLLKPTFPRKDNKTPTEPFMSFFNLSVPFFGNRKIKTLEHNSIFFSRSSQTSRSPVRYIFGAEKSINPQGHHRRIRLAIFRGGF